MTDSFRYIALHGVESHDDPRAVRAWRWIQWVLLALSLLAIPAFFLDLAAGPPILFGMGRLLYLIIFAGFFASFSLVVLLSRRRKQLLLRNQFDALILIGAAVSFVYGTSTWSSLEWVLRAAFMCAVGMRTALFLSDSLRTAVFRAPRKGRILRIQRRELEEIVVIRGLANVEFIEKVGGGLNSNTSHFSR